MSTITLDSMRDRLLTLEQAEAELRKTEPVTVSEVGTDTGVHFTMENGWTDAAEELDDTATVPVIMSIGGVDRPMTKEAAYMAASRIGLSNAYVRKTPANLIQHHLNYHYSTPEKAFSVLSVADTVSAFTRASLQPFSNMELFDSVVSGIRKQYGQDTEILADYKILNTLERTDVRFIVPEHARTITDGGMRDVPAGEADVWSAGVHLSNSVIGKTQTAVEAYLFRWWCTNGATTTLDNVGRWSRRSNGDGADVYLWAQEAVDEVLGGMEYRFNEVQALTGLNIAGNTADVVRDIFTQYEIPVSQREDITAQLLESETLTLYTVMNAITQAANREGLSPQRADRLMRIGGSIPTATFDLIKAKVWEEGHLAEPEMPNPYAIAGVSVN